MELFIVEKKPMTLEGGEVRQPGDLLPEAVTFSARAKQVLVDSGLMAPKAVQEVREYVGGLSVNRGRHDVGL